MSRDWSSSLLRPEVVPQPQTYRHFTVIDRSVAGRIEYIFLRYWVWWLGLVYVATGAFFVHDHVLIGDAVSRTAAARMMIAGYDPHLAAVGFVWGPLPTFLQLPLVALYPIIPWFVHDGYVAVLVSAPFAAWGVAQVHHMIVERGYERSWAILVSAGIAFNPLIFIFAGNGMTEMIYVAMLFGALRFLSRWEVHRKVSDLAYCGLWIGVDFLVRFESLAAGFGAIVFVVIVTYLDNRKDSRRDAIRRTGSNALILTYPIVFFTALFLGMSWWLTGVALPQYSSAYGNSALILSLGESTIASQRVPLVEHELIGLAPLLPLVVLVGVLVSVARGRSIFLCSLALLGPALLFDMEGLSTGGQFLLLRYLILAVPIVMLSLPLLWRVKRFGLPLGIVAVLIMMASGWNITGDPAYAGQEYAYHEAALGQPAAQYSDLQLAGAAKMADWLDARHLHDHSILVDTFTGFEVLEETRYPKHFVPPSATQFQQFLLHPYQLGIRYIIVITPAGPGSLYSLNRYFPGLYNGCIVGTKLAFSATISGTPAPARIYYLQKPIYPNDLHYNRTCPVHRIILG